MVWTLRLRESDNELKPIFGRLNNKVKIIQDYLKEKGVDKKGEITVSQFDVTDNLANVWGDDKPRYNYSVDCSVIVSSNDTKFISELVAQSNDLIDRDIILDSNSTDYDYTKFQQLKPEMMAEAISNAEKTAKQFAENSHSKINKIVEAGQGEFSIEDSEIPYKKNVRVVSTITYSLKD